MPIRNAAQLALDITTNINDNTTGDITASDIRSLMTDVVDTLFSRAAPPGAVGNYDPTRTYAAGEVVIQGGKLVVANGPTTPGPWNMAQWSDFFPFDKSVADALYASKNKPLVDYDPSNLYNQGDVVLHGGQIWTSTKMIDGTATPVPWNPADWTQITIDMAQVTADVASQERFQGVVVATPTAGEVSYGNIPAAGAANRSHYYMCGEAATLPGSLTASSLNGVVVQAGDMLYSDGTSWHVVATGSSGTGGISQAAADAAYAPIKQPIASFDGRKTYALGDQVIQNGQLYVCTTAGTGAWNAANWGAVAPPAVTEATTGKPAAGVGSVGDMQWDDTNIYIKTNAGWKAVKLDSAFA